ncbi:hypothetical protein KSC_048190 [Ktedonobacter sp. SOSP1-52]|nr:hypothetical protein KSC_048190 [Ktedonobacter sp. SOSP1-52]
MHPHRRTSHGNIACGLDESRIRFGADEKLHKVPGRVVAVGEEGKVCTVERGIAPTGAGRQRNLAYMQLIMYALEQVGVFILINKEVRDVKMRRHFHIPYFFIDSSIF